MSEEANRRIAEYLKTGANTLDLSGCDITSLKNLPRLQECTGLTSLNLSKNQIEKIEGLENLSKLESLYLRRNQISKIEGLENLSKLESLGLGWNQISKIEGLENLSKLERLDLNDNQIEKIEGLENLSKLTYLSLCRNQIGKIEGLKNLSKLERLELGGNQIGKIEGLENLSKLTYLSLCRNQIGKIEDLEKLSKLESLDLERNQIGKIEGLENLSGLTSLNLKDNQIRKIEGLENLSKLESLYLRRNQISKIEGLENLSKLESLDLNDNQIGKIEGLENLSKLESLDLGWNQISKIEGLENLSKLERLDLNDNQIGKIEGLEKLFGLTSLSLWGNQIGKIEGLENLSKLKSLNLEDNQIGKIEGLENLSKLESLYLEDNQISDISVHSIQNVLDGDLRNNRIRTFSYRDGDTPIQKKLPQSICNWGLDAVYAYINRTAGKQIAPPPKGRISRWQWILIFTFTIPDLNEEVAIGYEPIFWTLGSLALIIFLLLSDFDLPVFFLIVLAPLLLTRSKASTEEGLQLYAKAVKKTGLKSKNAKYLFFRAMALGFASIGIKVWVTLRHWIFHFGESLQRIPHNFRYYVFCSRLRDLPELVPGVDSYSRQEKSDPVFKSPQPSEHASNEKEAEENFSLLDLGYDFTSKYSFRDKKIRQFSGVGGLAIFFFFALIYRFSVKASALFYFPLVFLLQTADFGFLEKSRQNAGNTSGENSEFSKSRKKLGWFLNILSLSWLSYFWGSTFFSGFGKTWENRIPELFSIQELVEKFPDWAGSWMEHTYHPYILTVLTCFYLVNKGGLFLYFALAGNPQSQESAQKCKDVLSVFQRLLVGVYFIYLIFSVSREFVPWFNT